MAAETDTSPAEGTTYRAGALPQTQMESIVVRAPDYGATDIAPTAMHADTVQRLWGGSFTPLMAGSETSGRFSGAPLSCPSSAAVGVLSLVAQGRSQAWRHPGAVENLFCLDGRLEVQYGARLEQSVVLDRFDMVSIPTDVRHALVNSGNQPARVLVALSLSPGGSYEAVFDAEETLPAPTASALDIRFDNQRGREVDVETVSTRVARFAALVPYKKDLKSTGGLPPEATESLSAGSVCTLIVPTGHKGRSRTAPIYGNPGLYMSIAECRSGNDHPPAHAHWDTQESFFILDGTFEIYTGFDNESSVSVGPGDLVAIPPRVMRTFHNTTGRPARILAIIQGSEAMSDAVSYSRKLGAEFTRRFGPETLEAYRQIGMTFDAEERLQA